MLTDGFMTFFFTVPNQNIFHKETFALLLVLCGHTGPQAASALGRSSCSSAGMAPSQDLPCERTSATSYLQLNLCQCYFFQPLCPSIGTGISDVARSMSVLCFPITSMLCPGGQGGAGNPGAL